jgi:hypothetical protein
MRHHTVTATFSAPPEEVFAYLANVDNLPEGATEFARELRLVDGRYKVVNGLGEFFFEIHADPDSGVIDMHAGPREDSLKLFPTRVVPPRCKSQERCSSDLPWRLVVAKAISDSKEVGR